MSTTTDANFSAPTNTPTFDETSLVVLGMSSTPNMQWFANQIDALFIITRQKAE